MSVSTSTKNHDVAAGLFQALLREANEWACSAEEQAVVERAQEIGGAEALSMLNEHYLLPSQLSGPVEEALEYLAPDLFGA